MFLLKDRERCQTDSKDLVAVTFAVGSEALSTLKKRVRFDKTLEPTLTGRIKWIVQFVVRLQRSDATGPECSVKVKGNVITVCVSRRGLSGLLYADSLSDRDNVSQFYSYMIANGWMR